MNLYTSNNLNNTTAMLFNGVGNEYYNYNFGGCGCGGSIWTQMLMNNIGGFNYGCGCGTGNAGLGYAMFSGLLNGLTYAGINMYASHKSAKAAKAAEEKTSRQNFDKALETLGLNDKSEAQLLQMSDADIDAKEIDSDYDDVALQGVRDSITALKGEIETSKKTTEVNLKNTYEGYNKTWKAMPETTTDEKTAKEAYYKNTVKPAYEAWQAQVKARGEQEKELKELEKQEKTIIEKQTAFRNAKKTVKDYIAKTLKPAQEAKAQNDKKANGNNKNTQSHKKDREMANQNLNANQDPSAVYANEKGNDGQTTLQNLIDAYGAITSEADTQHIDEFIAMAKLFTPAQRKMINDSNIQAYLEAKKEQIKQFGL